MENVKGEDGFPLGSDLSSEKSSISHERTRMERERIRARVETEFVLPLVEM